MTNSPQPFFVKNCTLAAIATGFTANSLIELRDKLAIVDENCLYYHFWGIRMYPQFIYSQHHNDFAAWVYHRLHDSVLAEKLSIINPNEFQNLEALRQELLEILDNQLDDLESVFWTKKDDRFHFITSMIIIFETEHIIQTPQDLAKSIEGLPPNSIFYHFIDARARTVEKIDDFSAWLKTYGNQYEILVEAIQGIDPHFLTMNQVKNQLLNIVNNYFSNLRD